MSCSDPLSPLTDIPDDEGLEAFTNNADNHPNNQEDIFIINTNFNPYLEENRKFPCGRSDEEREDFTKLNREHVEKHAVTPSNLEELASLVRLSFQIIFIVTDCHGFKVKDQLKTGKRENPMQDFIRINPTILNGYILFISRSIYI